MWYNRRESGMKIIARFLLILCLVVAGAAYEVAHAQTPPPVQVLPDPPRGGDPIAPVVPGLQQPAPLPPPRPAPSPEPRARGASPGCLISRGCVPLSACSDPRVFSRLPHGLKIACVNALRGR